MEGDENGIWVGFFVGTSWNDGNTVRRGWKVWCWGWTRSGFVWCPWKKEERVVVVLFSLFFLKEKLVHKVGLCFGLSSSSQWISPLFIRVERKVWDVYLDSWPLIQMEKILSLAKSEHHKLLKLGCTSWSSCCLWDGAATPTKTTT